MWERIKCWLPAKIKAGYQYFVLFPQCFQKQSFSDQLNSGLCNKALSCKTDVNPVKMAIISPHSIDSMVFNAVFITVFQLYHGSQCTNPWFPSVLLTCTLHNILFKPLVLSHITMVETTDSGERGMNPVAMTIINPRKEYWPSRGSNQRPPVLSVLRKNWKKLVNQTQQLACFKADHLSGDAVRLNGVFPSFQHCFNHFKATAQINVFPGVHQY